MRCQEGLGVLLSLSPCHAAKALFPGAVREQKGRPESKALRPPLSGGGRDGISFLTCRVQTIMVAFIRVVMKNN